MASSKIHGMAMNRALTVICACVVAAPVAAAAPGDAKARRVGERSWQDVRVLAHDNMEGRNTGSKAIGVRQMSWRGNFEKRG